ncbi:MAG: hypothetical protein ABIQ18_05495 [Umezawaea sp.]
MSRRASFASSARLCRVCGYRLTEVSGRGVHPLCVDEDELWWSTHDLEAAVRSVAHQAASTRSASGDVVAAVCSLIAGDPRNHEHVRAVVSAILRDASEDPFWRTTANGWRPHLPAWLRPATVGATVQRLIAAGLLRPTGRYVRCTDTASGNRGKPQPVYEIDVTALDSAERAAEQPQAS